MPAEVARVFAMSAAWDEAAAALSRFDFAGCDQAMAKFNALKPVAKHHEADAGEISKTGKKRLRRELFEKQGGKCVYCDGDMLSGSGSNMASFEHIHPESLGGATDETNLVLACWQCNRLRGNLTPDQMRRIADRVEQLQTLNRGAGGSNKATDSNSDG